MVKCHKQTIGCFRGSQRDAEALEKCRNLQEKFSNSSRQDQMENSFSVA